MTVLKVLRRKPDRTLWSMCQSLFEVQFQRDKWSYSHLDLPSSYGLTALDPKDIDVAFRWVEESDDCDLEAWVCCAGGKMKVPPRRLNVTSDGLVVYDSSIPFENQADLPFPSETLMFRSLCPRYRITRSYE